ncbi:helix-turn-helix domain-containing protein [Blastococcus capsensis]|uniref:helix-turn-helix domain-containing protein n=1 Tax=Blastococcus capsensis TaxID=1564163 RepID=UPI002540F5E8|nr:helix-turn-helix transcriptional regulator [Blastococcus capsensis]MDK3257018.1 helix-turn-helix transcriptional regulator [Blastococcus capsensis]
MSAPGPVIGPHGVDRGAVSLFDLPGVLRRIRRLGDLSQRELAEGCRLSQSAVAQAETGRRDLPVTALARAAALAGLRLALLDGEEREVGPMAADTVRDLGGRRFPAHLDTRRNDEGQRLYQPRRDRPETSFTYRRDRGDRDARRGTAGTPTDHHPVLPGDSPAGRRAARRVDAAHARAAERERRFLAGELTGLPEAFSCTCLPSCDELDDFSRRPVHAGDCACGCDLG